MFMVELVLALTADLIERGTEVPSGVFPPVVLAARTVSVVLHSIPTEDAPEAIDHARIVGRGIKPTCSEQGWVGTALSWSTASGSAQ